MAWYIDTWATRDGLAFVSNREPRYLKCSQTSYISPPFFRPIPISNISTGLGAGRGGFQERLLDKDGKEIPFESLTQIIELVRRAYLKGGSGLQPGGGEGVEKGPAPDFPNPYPSELLDGPNHNKSIASMEQINHLIKSLDHENRKKLSQSFRKRLDESFKGPKWRDFKLLSLFSRDVRLLLAIRRSSVKNLSPESLYVRDTFAFWCTLNRYLIFEEGAHGMEYKYSVRIKEHEYPYYCDYHFLRNQISNGILYEIPLPSHWTIGGVESTLGDHMNSILSDRSILFDAISQWVPFIPVLFCSLIMALAADMPKFLFSYLPRDFVRTFLSPKAADWLSSSLPDKILDNHPAEDIITELEFKDRSTWKPIRKKRKS